MGALAQSVYCWSEVRRPPETRIGTVSFSFMEDKRPNDFVGVEIAACLAEDHSWQSLPTWPGVTSAYDRIERNGCSFSATIVYVAQMYVSSTLHEIPIRQPIRDVPEPSRSEERRVGKECRSR